MLRRFEFHQVHERLLVGPVPSSPEKIAALRAAGVTALLSLQTDDDLEALSLNWSLLWNFLMHNGISGNRLPIVDFDDRALERGLPKAVDALHDAWRSGQTVYVHCTAGINRSPTVAIGWLMRHGGLSLDDAWQQVRAARACDPNYTALSRYAKQLS